MLGFLKPQAEKALTPIASLLKNVNPNVVTMFGLVFPVIFFWCVLNEYYALALVVFIFNGVDMIDGLIARSQNKVTAFGGFLDSTIDRFADFVVIVAFGFAGLVSWEITLTLVLFTYLISYIRSRIELAANNKISANVGIIERTERLLMIFIGLALYALFPNAIIFGQNIISAVFIIMIVLSIITVGQRVHFAYKKLR